MCTVSLEVVRKSYLIMVLSSRTNCFEYKVYTPPYRPQCNGKIEGFHKYLKSCIAKHIINNMEWDNFTDLATAAYNFIPNVTLKESPFFLMFRRDPYMPLNKFLSQAMRYLGTDEGIPDLEAL